MTLNQKCGRGVAALMGLAWACWCQHSGVEAADYWVDASGGPGGDGSRARPFKTIQAAAEVAQAGDTIHVLPGTYRERVMPPRGGEPGRPIVYLSERRHGAIVKGSEVWRPAWRRESGGIYSGELDNSLFTDTGYVDGGNPYRIAYDWDYPRNNRPPYPFKAVRWTLGQVFVDGRPLEEGSSREELVRREQVWWYDAGSNRIFVNLGGDSPANHLVELTTRRGVFRPLKKGLGYIEVRGFVFEHCGNQFPARFWADEANAQSGMVGTRGGHHWVIADNVIRHAKSVGLTFGGSRGGRAGDTFDNERPAQTDPARDVTGFHRIVGNIFEANGAIGAMGCGHTGVVFEGNVFRGNNALRNTAYEIGGIKTHQAYDLRIEGNWFVDNECMGVWLDNTWRHCRITRNIFVRNRGKSIFLEMDDNTPDTGVLIDRNVILLGPPRYTPGGPPDERKRRPTQPWSVGIYGHDADGIRIEHNLIAGDGYGLYFRKITSRKGGTAYIRAEGNLLAGGAMTAVCLPVEHPPHVRDNHFDFNVYPGSPDERRFAATAWSQPDGSMDKAGLERLGRRLAELGSPAEPFADPGRQPVGFRLNLETWRKVMNFDHHSVLARVGCRLDRRTWTLELDVPAEVLQMRRVGSSELSKDFFGQPFAANALPGPFASVRAGKQSIRLSPPLWLSRNDAVGAAFERSRSGSD